MTTLNLNSIISIPVVVSPLAAPRNDFTNFLIIGNSTHLSTTVRLKKYASLAEMVSDGFLTTDPEYIAASLFIGSVYDYFGTGAAFNLWVGVQGAQETALEAVTACREASPLWYACMLVSSGLVDADHLAVAGYVETVNPATIYVVTASAAGIPAGTANNLAEELQGAARKRTLIMYSTDQDDEHPDNIYATASLMGYAMGANTGLAKSAYTLKFKSLPGIYVEPLTQAEATELASQNCNFYANFGNYYDWFTEGKMANGWFFDKLMNIDMLVSDIQLNVADLLNGKATLNIKNKEGVIETTEYVAEKMDSVMDELTDFVCSIKGEKTSCARGEDGLRALALADRIKKHIA